MPVNRFVPGLLPRLHIARQLWLALLGALGYSLIVATLLHFTQVPVWHSGLEWAVVNSLIIGILVVFRNKEAYDRWWEARKLWGQLTNDSRNLILKARCHIDPNRDDFRRFAMLLMQFAEVLRLHLRRAPDEEMIRVLGSAPPHPPSHAAGELFAILESWRREGLSDGAAIMLDLHARGLMDVCGACERILNSPIPSSYRALTRHGIGFYLIASPWLVTVELGFAGIPPLLIALYFLLGVELIAEEVEQPFSNQPDDLPLETFCRTIEVSVRQAAGLAEPV